RRRGAGAMTAATRAGGPAIVVGLDASPRARAVLAAATDVAREKRGTMILVRAVSIPVELPTEALSIPPQQLPTTPPARRWSYGDRSDSSRSMSVLPSAARMRVLVLNRGSSSLKYALFDGLARAASGTIERLSASDPARELDEITSALAPFGGLPGVAA